MSVCCWQGRYECDWEPKDSLNESLEKGLEESLEESLN